LIKDFFAAGGVTADPELPSAVPVARSDGCTRGLDGTIGLSRFLRMAGPFGELRECRRSANPRCGEAQLFIFAILFVAAFFIRTRAMASSRT
jgi:hypothetical protein